MQRLETTLSAMRALRAHLDESKAMGTERMARCDADWRASAENLIQYSALRDADHLALQADLVRLGLSSISRRGAHVRATVDALLDNLECLSGGGALRADHGEAMDAGVAALERHATALLGAPHPSGTRIMVSLPPDAHTRSEWLRSLIDAGMDLARINAAHGDPDQWRANALALKRVAASVGRRIPLCVDLAGPKVRTGFCVGDAIVASTGDELLLHARDQRSQAGTRGVDGVLTRPHTIAVSPAAVVAALQPGHRVMIDDGNVRGRCISVDADHGSALIRVERVRGGAWPIKDRKGVNVPDSDVAIASFTEADERTLDAVSECADMVAMSFVRTAADITCLQSALAARGLHSLGIVAKIETPQACRALPEVLLALMRRPPCGVMLARGDLGVEIGFESLPLAQVEVLSLCEAAHMPVIWATQVLESMSDNGFPTRGEVTDAADSAQADAVMLGIGPYLLETTAFAHDLLMRIQRVRARSRALLVHWPLAQETHPC